MKKMIAAAILLGMVLSLAACGGQNADNSSVSSDPAHYVSYGEVSSEVSDSFFRDMWARSNQLVIVTMKLTGNDIQVASAEECTMTFSSEDRMRFTNRVDQGSNSYAAEIEWKKDADTGWQPCYLEINDEVYMDEVKE